MIIVDIILIIAKVSVAKIFFNNRLPRKQIEKLKPLRRDERDSRSWFGLFGSKTPKKKSSQSKRTSSDRMETDSPRNSLTEEPKQKSSEQVNNNNQSNYGKTLELSSDDLKKLNLNYGKNEIKYEVFSMLQVSVVYFEAD